MITDDVGSAQSERGSAVIEFALMILVLMLLAVGAVNFGMAIQQGMIVTAAAHAGAQYGIVEGNVNDIAGMQTAAQNSAKGISSFGAVASTWCACAAGGTAVSCASTCNSFDLPIQYVRVQTSATVPLLFRFTGMPVSISLTGNSTLRAR